MADKVASSNGYLSEVLPSPGEANRIATALGRPTLAIDGQYYSGEEVEAVELELRHNDVDLSREEVSSVVDAINVIADCDAAKWLSEVDRQRLEHLWAGSVDLAIDRLTELRQKLWELRLRPPAV